MTSPTVAVVICAYTDLRWASIVAGLDALTRQTLAPNEVFVSVDHNPDLYERLVKEVRDLALPLTIINGLDGPQGIGSARNAGVNAARSDIVAFLDDDATPEPAWLEELVRPFADPRVVMTAGRVLPRWLGTERPPRWFPPEYLWVVGATWRGFGHDGAAIRNPVGASMAARRAALNHVQGFDVAINYGNDETDLCQRLLRAFPGQVVRYTASSVIHHEVPAGRNSLRYFFRRCWIEGNAKGRTTAQHGQGMLLRELDYCVRYLTTGVLGSLATLRFVRAFCLVGGFSTTLVGWFYSRARTRA